MSPLVCLVRKNVPWQARIDPDHEVKYRETLVNNAPRIYSRMQKKIKDNGDYVDKMATPSSKAMPQIFQPTFVAKSERNYSNILTLHSQNAASGYNKYKKGLEHQFGTVDGVPAKRYIDAVNAKSSNWTEKVEKKTLRFTGDKIRGRGPAPFAGYWLTGYALAVSMLTEGDELVIGGPYNVVVAGQHNAFKAGLQMTLIQAGLMIDAAGYTNAEMTAQNTRINHLIQSNIDPGLGLVPFAPAGESHCDYQLVHGLFRLEIQVTQI